ncbi:hypothetical protein H5410_047683 [Solanum commersonii]|uniref:Uncharacterized protein n=1 Tax=Solanum commersonii TaxID=4109 RepID=A0A9J5XFU3_SOLCO|nr:hypothetical protein H5410_047683 [Solanum commersonii]
MYKQDKRVKDNLSSDSCFYMDRSDTFTVKALVTLDEASIELCHRRKSEDLKMIRGFRLLRFLSEHKEEFGRYN